MSSEKNIKGLRNDWSIIVSGSVYDAVNTGNIANNSANLDTNRTQSLAQVAVEIEELLHQLEQSYPTSTTLDKMNIATEAIEHIDNNPRLAQRTLSALKAGGISALEQLLNHPAASFFIGALDDWKQNKGR